MATSEGGLMSTRSARVSRGLAAAVFATIAAAVSHTLAGGDAPSTVGLVLALAFSAMVSIALTGRRLSLPRLAAAVVSSQFAFHTLFGTMGAGSGVVVSSGHHEALSLAEGASAVTTHAHGTDAWMWTAHAVAAALTILALRYGERAFWALRDTAALFLARILRALPQVPVAVHTDAHRRVPGAAFVPRLVILLRSCLLFRGPPVSSLA